MMNKVEQKARIRNLIADTALKRAEAQTEHLKVAAVYFTALATILGVLGSFIKWLLG